MGDLLSYPLSSLARSDKSGWLLQFWLSLQSLNVRIKKGSELG